MGVISGQIVTAPFELAPESTTPCINLAVMPPCLGSVSAPCIVYPCTDAGFQFSPYTGDLWTLFHPKLSEPSIAAHHNKQALLMFWCTVCIDCPENVQLIVTSPHITKNIGFNYIL